MHPISIHAPRTGSDVIDALTAQRIEAFQSTLPARGATTDGDAQAPPRKISIHAPRTGSDPPCPCAWHDSRNFNPRSPHGERLKLLCECYRFLLFQSTLPARGATIKDCHMPHLLPISIHAPRTGSDAAGYRIDARINISIHAPRTGSDHSPSTTDCESSDFNPRSPHGERRRHRVPSASC